jgi:hypothetical protein
MTYWKKKPNRTYLRKHVTKQFIKIITDFPSDTIYEEFETNIRKKMLTNTLTVNMKIKKKIPKIYQVTKAIEKEFTKTIRFTLKLQINKGLSL